MCFISARISKASFFVFCFFVYFVYFVYFLITKCAKTEATILFSILKLFCPLIKLFTRANRGLPSNTVALKTLQARHHARIWQYFSTTNSSLADWRVMHYWKPISNSSGVLSLCAGARDEVGLSDCTIASNMLMAVGDAWGTVPSCLAYHMSARLRQGLY